MIATVGCEGSGHHGLSKLIWLAIRRAWNVSSVVTIANRGVTHKVYAALTSGIGLCWSLQQLMADEGLPKQAPVLLGYSFPTHEAMASSKWHAPMYNLTLMEKELASCHWTLDTISLERPLVSRIASRVTFEGMPEHHGQTGGPCDIKQGKCFGWSHHLNVFVREQVCFKRHIDQMLPTLRRPFFSLSYEGVSQACAQQLMQLASFLGKAAKPRPRPPGINSAAARVFCEEEFHASSRRSEDVLSPLELALLNRTAGRLQTGKDVCRQISHGKLQQPAMSSHFWKV